MSRSRSILMVTAALALSTAAPLQAEKASTLAEAKALAAEQNVPLLLDFYTDWCKWCKKFDADSKTDVEIKAALRKVVMHQIDAEKGEGIQIAESYEVQGFPTFLLVNSAGTPIHRWIGYDRDEWLTAVATGVADPTTIDQKIERFKAHPTEKDATTLATYHGALNEARESVAYLRQAQRLKQDSKVDYRYSIFEKMASGSREDHFPLSDVRQAANAVLAYEAHSVDQAVDVARMMTTLGRRANDHEIMVPYLKVAVRESEDAEDEDLQAARMKLLVDHALFVEKDSNRAIEYRKQTMPEGWMENAGQLNSFAWWCFENNLNLEEADALSRRGVELAEPGTEKAMILDTLAEICNVRGSCKDAVYFIELAIQEHPASKHYPKQLQRFQELLAAE